MTTLTRTVRRTGAALLAAIALTVLAACGGGGADGDDVASLGSTTTTADGGGNGPLSLAEQEDAMLAYTECMRDNGVDMPDPVTADSEGNSEVVVVDAAAPTDQDAFAAAQEECGPLIEDAFGDVEQLSPEEEAKMRDEMLAFAKCMREQGIDMPDPTFDSGEGGSIITEETGGGPKPSAEEFQAAQAECQPELGESGHPLDQATER